MKCGRRHGGVMKETWILAVTLLLAFCAVAQQTPSALQGSWIATAGPTRSLRGHWFARIPPDSKNTASGSWELVNESNQVVLKGTWSARKLKSGWQGTWSARIQNSRTITGTWDAAIEDVKDKTLEDMLKRAAEKQISGIWQSGRAHGEWWLQR